MSEEKEWTVQEEDHHVRIDHFIRKKNGDWSRTQIQKWIKDGHIVVNHKRVKPNYKVEVGDDIKAIIPNEEIDIKPEPIPLHILYEDSDIIIINKERGVVVHPAPGHYSGTIVNGLLYKYPELEKFNDVIRPGIVHRIDKDTSGILIVAKNEHAKQSLSEQLKDRNVKRLYKAIVHGVIPHDHGTIDAPIGRDVKDRQMMTVTNENSREAITHFTVLERFEQYTFVECELITGRTHQIRVHMKYIGFPIAGDPKYGPKKTLSIDGQALHATSVMFRHPTTGEEVYFEAPLPEDMESQLQILRKM